MGEDVEDAKLERTDINNNKFKIRFNIIQSYNLVVNETRDQK